MVIFNSFLYVYQRVPPALQILRHQQRVENMKPSAVVQRQEQERSLAKGRRPVDCG